MEMISFYSTYLNQNFLLTVKDLIEIILFSYGCYQLMRWLKKDKNNNLIHYFYGFFLLTILSYLTPLPTVATALILTSPALLLVLAFMHQDVLQKNLIPVATNSYQAVIDNWLDLFMQALLMQKNKKKDLLIIIEDHDNLDGFLHSSYRLHNPFSIDLLELLISTPLFDPTAYLWLSRNGFFKGINATWQKIMDDQWPWDCLAEFYTQRVDSIIIHSNGNTQAISLVCDGAITTNIAIHELKLLLKDRLSLTTKDLKKEAHYGKIKTETVRERSS